MFTQHYDTKSLDASVLLILLFGFLRPTNERVRNTVLAIADELAEDEMVLRYRLDETDDGFSGEEGTFTICSFWLVSAPVEIGELARAKTLCGKLLSSASSLRALRRGDRPEQRPAPRQLPAGVHPPGADQRGNRCDRGGAGAGQQPRTSVIKAPHEFPDSCPYARAARRQTTVSAHRYAEAEPVAGSLLAIARAPSAVHARKDRNTGSPDSSPTHVLVMARRSCRVAAVAWSSLPVWVASTSSLPCRAAISSGLKSRTD